MTSHPQLILVLLAALALPLPAFAEGLPYEDDFADAYGRSEPGYGERHVPRGPRGYRSAGGFGWERPLSVPEAAAACRVDIEQHCQGVLPGRGRIIACLAGNRDRLTPSCEDVLRRVERFFGRGY